MTASPMIVRLGLLIAAIGGCASHGPGTPGDGSGVPCDPVGGGPVSPGSTLGGIDYRVTGGFTGQGDGTSLQIAPDGAVTRQTRLKGTEHGQLDPATFDNLVSTARAAQLPTLCAMYPCSGCNDDYVHDVSVRFDGNTYRVQVSISASPLPDRLRSVLDALQAIVTRPLP